MTSENFSAAAAEGEAEPEGGFSATTEEVIIPPLAISGAIIFCLLVLSIFDQRNWWKAKLFRGTRYVSLENDSELSLTQTDNFLTEFDLEVLHRFKSFQNNPNGIVRIAFPTLLSMLLCPMAILIHKPLLDFSWPSGRFPSAPDINTAVNCFLMPSGLVYAIAFGFIFQDVMCSFQLLSTHITEQISMFSQIIKMTNSVRCFTAKQRKDICLCVKDEVIRWIEILIGTKNMEAHRSDRLCNVLNIIRDTQADTESGILDSQIVDQMVLQVMNLDIRTKKQHHFTISNISILLWLFMETLGFISFFGVLMISAQSYRMELIMCLLTILSLSLFCYILADFDAPFHGIFKIKLSPIRRLVSFVEDTYEGLETRTTESSSA